MGGGGEGIATGQEGLRERGVVGGQKGPQPSGTSIRRRMVLELATQMTCIYNHISNQFLLITVFAL